MATQYATTKVGYTYAIVHPSEADIRFIGCDNSSDDGFRVLRVSSFVNSSNATITIELGDLFACENKTYAAAFGITNEELFPVNLTYVTVSGASSYVQMWVKGNGSCTAENCNTSKMIYDNGSGCGYTSDSSTAWRFAPGDGNVNTMRTNVSGLAKARCNLTTPWDNVAHVRYNDFNLSGKDEWARPMDFQGGSATNASDFCWIQVSVNVPQYDAVGGVHTGTITFHFKASTHLDSQGTGSVGFQGVAQWAKGPTGAG
jgi:hypothetical protein